MSYINFSKEFKFIIKAIQYPTEEVKENLSTFLMKPNSINWKEVTQILQNNQLLGLCYTNLNKYGLLGKIPVGILNILKESYTQSCMRNMFIIKNISTFLQNWFDEGLKIIPYKGLYLTANIFKNYGIRIFNDIDILIPKNQYSQFRKILKNTGFKPIYGEWYEKIESKLFYETSWVHSYIKIDVHWRLNQFLFFEEITKYDAKEIWRKAKTCEIYVAKCYEMDMSDQILSHCIDTMCMHHLGSIRNFSDLDWIINTYREDINWAELIELCKKYRISKVIYYPLYYLKNMFESPIPGWFLESIKPDNRKIENLWFDYCASENMLSGREDNFYRELSTNIISIYNTLHKNILRGPIPDREKIFLLNSIPLGLKSGMTVLLLSERYDRLSLFNKFINPEIDYLKLIYFIQNEKKEKMIKTLHPLFMLFFIYPSIGLCLSRALRSKIRSKRKG